MVAVSNLELTVECLDAERRLYEEELEHLQSLLVIMSSKLKQERDSWKVAPHYYNLRAPPFHSRRRAAMVAQEVEALQSVVHTFEAERDEWKLRACQMKEFTQALLQRKRERRLRPPSYYGEDKKSGSSSPYSTKSSIFRNVSPTANANRNFHDDRKTRWRRWRTRAVIQKYNNKLAARRRRKGGNSDNEEEGEEGEEEDKDDSGDDNDDNKASSGSNNDDDSNAGGNGHDETCNYYYDDDDDDLESVSTAQERIQHLEVVVSTLQMGIAEYKEEVLQIRELFVVLENKIRQERDSWVNAHTNNLADRAALSKLLKLQSTIVVIKAEKEQWRQEALQWKGIYDSHQPQNHVPSDIEEYEGDDGRGGRGANGNYY